MGGGAQKIGVFHRGWSRREATALLKKAGLVEGLPACSTRSAVSRIRLFCFSRKTQDKELPLGACPLFFCAPPSDRGVVFLTSKPKTQKFNRSGPCGCGGGRLCRGSGGNESTHVPRRRPHLPRVSYSGMSAKSGGKALPCSEGRIHEEAMARGLCKDRQLD